MLHPACQPIMDASSPQCRCPQCSLVRTLRPAFPHLVWLRLSPDQRRVAMVVAPRRGHELWIGDRIPLRLTRAWRAAPDETLGPPVFSEDGAHACVPLQGSQPGLFVLSDLGGPRRISDGHDVDPRWVDDHLAFYRLQEDGQPLPLRVSAAA